MPGTERARIKVAGAKKTYASGNPANDGQIRRPTIRCYMPGKRSDSWLKIKSRMQQEAVIGGVTEGEGARKYFGALMLGVF